jgi:hypothetical protein
MSPTGRFGLVVRVSYAKLYDTLGACLKDDKSTLLLYSLLHANPSFLEYALVRTDLDTLVSTHNSGHTLLLVDLLLANVVCFRSYQVPRSDLRPHVMFRPWKGQGYKASVRLRAQVKEDWVLKPFHAVS